MTESKKVAKKIEQKETKTKKCLGISQKDFGFLSLLAGWRWALRDSLSTF